jgi:hypothetical protein
MKLTLLISSMLAFGNIAAINTNDINYIRKEFNLALNNAQKASALHAQLIGLMPAKNTLQYAYLGATEAILAKHSFNPFTKLGYVNSALDKLNNAIMANKNNIEIRFMRYSIESELPFYLGLSKHIQEDKNAVIEGLKNIKPTTENSEMIKVFASKLSSASICNKEEKVLLNNIVSTCNQVINPKNQSHVKP